MQFESLPESAVLERACHAAEYCWLTLRQDPWAETLTQADLKAVMGTDELTQSALRTFDADGDGSIQEQELHERLQRRYKCAPPPLSRGRKPWTGLLFTSPPPQLMTPVATFLVRTSSCMNMSPQPRL